MTTQIFDVPTLHITKSKNRLKEYNSSVYLKDQDEFELEIFNPKTVTVLAKISINGVEMSNGLIIRPGERVFLDRFIDEPKKFKFNTYNVEGNNYQVKKAIENNGVIDVKFFDEQIKVGDNLFYTTDYTTPSIFDMDFNSGNYNCKATFTTNTMCNGTGNMLNPLNASKSIETGKIEKGCCSNTKLKMFSMDFNNYFSLRVTLKILPESQKPMNYSDIKTYCSNCGIRIKKSTWKFCPSCGDNLNN